MHSAVCFFNKMRLFVRNVIEEVFVVDERRQITAKTVIIILSVLLAMSVLALAGVLLYRLFHNPAHASAVIPGNIVVEETI